MKVAESRIGHEGTLQEMERTLMSFDDKSIAHIMSILTDMYSNPALAVIREYSVNALDSHVAARVKKPIEVTLPSRFDPNFMVRDYGTGMDKQELIDRYSKYGASSKRETNTEAGMLGIGCKAALTYTSQFIVKSTKDGTTHTVLVTRDTSGTGALQFIESEKTDEPNGVLVTVPVKDMVAFNSQAHEFFSYWVPQLVLVDGEHPVPFHADVNVKQLLDEFWIVPGGGKDKAVMGNIPYPLDTKQISMSKLGMTHGYSAVFVVPIGSVDFAPSREALQYSKRTMTTLTTFFDKVKSKSTADIQKLVDAEPNVGLGAEVAFTWQNIFPKMSFNYRGTPLPSTYTVQASDNIRTWRRGSNSTEVTTNTMIRYRDVHTALNVINFKGSSVTASMKELIDKEKPLPTGTVYSARTVYFWQSCPFENALNPDRILDLDKHKVKTSSARKPTPVHKLPKYGYVQKNGTVSERVDYPEEGSPIIWGNKGASYQWVWKDVLPYLDLEKTPFIVVSSQQTDKFRRLHPDAVDWRRHAAKVGDALWDGVDHADVEINKLATEWMIEVADGYSDGEVTDALVNRWLLSVQRYKDKRELWVKYPSVMQGDRPQSSTGLLTIEREYPYLKHRSPSTRSERKMVNGRWTYVAVKDPGRQFRVQVIEYINALNYYRENHKP